MAEALETLPLVPLRDMVVFPHQMSPFVVGRESSIRALEKALATSEKRIFLSAQKNPKIDEPRHRLFSRPASSPRSRSRKNS